MRALCGAIITAGALIGLGLTALAYGIRFQGLGPQSPNPDTHQLYAIPSMAIVLIALLCALVIGLGISFMGLAYHHERRHREHLRDHGMHTPHTPTTMMP